MKKYHTAYKSHVVDVLKEEDKIIQQNSDNTSNTSAKCFKYKFYNNSLQCLTEHYIDNTPNFSSAQKSDECKFSPLDITNNNSSTVKIPIAEHGFAKNINTEEKDWGTNNNLTVNFSIKCNSNEKVINFTFNVIFDSQNEKILSSNNDKVLAEKDHKIASIEFSIESNSSNSLQTNYQIVNTPSEIFMSGNDALIQGINIGNDIN